MIVRRPSTLVWAYLLYIFLLEVFTNVPAGREISQNHLLKTFCFSSSIFYQSEREAVKIGKNTKRGGEIASRYQFHNG